VHDSSGLVVHGGSRPMVVVTGPFLRVSRGGGSGFCGRAVVWIFSPMESVLLRWWILGFVLVRTHSSGELHLVPIRSGLGCE